MISGTYHEELYIKYSLQFGSLVLLQLSYYSIVHQVLDLFLTAKTEGAITALNNPFTW